THVILGENRANLRIGGDVPLPSLFGRDNEGTKPLNAGSLRSADQGDVDVNPGIRIRWAHCKRCIHRFFLPARAGLDSSLPTRASPSDSASSSEPAPGGASGESS